MRERHNDLPRFSPKMQAAIRVLCEARNLRDRRLGISHTKPCVDSELACFECQDKAGAWPASAMSAGTAKTAQPVEGEARQRDGCEDSRDAQTQSRNTGP